MDSEPHHVTLAVMGEIKQRGVVIHAHAHVHTNHMGNCVQLKALI